MSEQLPSNKENQVENPKRRERLIERLRAEGPESEEVRKLFLEWRTLEGEALQMPIDEGIREERMNDLGNIFNAGGSFEDISTRLNTWEQEHKAIPGHRFLRKRNKAADIRLEMEAAEIYFEAQRENEGLEALEVVRYLVWEEATAARSEEEYNAFVALDDEITERATRLVTERYNRMWN